MPTLTEQQLAAWMKLAEHWPCDLTDDGVRRCTLCGKGIMLVTDSSGRPFRYTPEQVDALTVLHLRNHHADLDPATATQAL